jgi:hypothetical protein
MNIPLLIGVIVLIVILYFLESIKSILKGWEKIDEKDVPKWVWDIVWNSGHEVNYIKGKTFIYKGLKLAGDRQGEYNYKFYRKLRHKKIKN